VVEACAYSCHQYRLDIGGFDEFGELCSYLFISILRTKLDTTAHTTSNHISKN